jgi:AcrR family transcriptional regulator
MARPQSATDDQILQAALQVMVRRGHDGFTLSEVAAEVGLSRAALILRFKSTRALKTTLTARIVDRFVQSLRSLPVTRSGEGLIELVAFIGGMISTPGSLTAYMRKYHSNVNDEELAKLEHRRAEALRNAVSERMPAVAIHHESAVAAFVAHIGGSLMQWEVQTDSDARTYLTERTKEWLILAQLAPPNHVAEAQPPPAKVRVRKLVP